MLHHNSRSTLQSGFSLVELSIVLVILGLLAGGVLVGQQLIKAAELRAQMEQLKTFQTGVNTFRLRFDSLPGDMSNATQHFLATEWPDMEDGNGNERLNDADGDYVELSGELTQFWMQLGAAKLIEGSYSNDTGVGLGFPETAVGRNGIIAVYDETVFEDNVFYVGVADSGSAINGANSLTPSEAGQIDKKFDDGHPLFGKIRARGGDGDFNQPVIYFSSIIPPESHPAAVYASFIAEMLIPSAHAEHTETLAEACTYMETDGTTEENEQGAYYLQTNSRPACQLSVKME